MAGPRRKPAPKAGERFGMLTVLKESPCLLRGFAASIVLCDCGAELVRTNAELRRSAVRGLQQSCGCWRRARAEGLNLRHGQARTCGSGPTGSHRSWVAMMDRCYRGGTNGYENYGGRGIKVCERWHLFENFFADMGERPRGATLDRSDVNRDYEPSNCRWASAKEQARNKRNTIWLTVDGDTRSVPEWSESTGLPGHTIIRRIRAGWSARDVVSRPVRQARTPDSAISVEISSRQSAAGEG